MSLTPAELAATAVELYREVCGTIASLEAAECEAVGVSAVVAGSPKAAIDALHGVNQSGLTRNNAGETPHATSMTPPIPSSSAPTPLPREQAPAATVPADVLSGGAAAATGSAAAATGTTSIPSSNEALEASNTQSPSAPALTLMVPDVLLDEAVQQFHIPVHRDSGSLNAADMQDLPYLIGIQRLSGTDSDNDSEMSETDRRELKTSRSVCSSTTAEGYETINEYMIIDQIGEGQFGRVLLAVNEKTQETRAIKVLPKKAIKKRRGHSHTFESTTSGNSSSGFLSSGPASADNQSALAAIKNEIAIMKKLRHRNIVTLYEVIDDDTEDSLYLVMQYAENGTLLQLDDAGCCTPLDVEQVKKYMRQLVAGLSYLEKHKVVHYDLKPANIVLTKNDEVLIADFGLSEVLDLQHDDGGGADSGSGGQGGGGGSSSSLSLGASGAKLSGGAPESKKSKMKGTPAFCSPQILAGEENIGSEADVWSLGVILCAMLWGRLPFATNSWRETVRSVMEAEPQLPPDADPEWADLVRGMLDKDPRTRTTLQALRRHPLLRDGRRTPSSGSLTPMNLSFVLSPQDLQSVFTAKAPSQHDYSPQKPHSPPRGSATAPHHTRRHHQHQSQPAQLQSPPGPGPQQSPSSASAANMSPMNSTMGADSFAAAMTPSAAGSKSPSTLTVPRAFR